VHKITKQTTGKQRRMQNNQNETNQQQNKAKKKNKKTETETETNRAKKNKNTYIIDYLRIVPFSLAPRRNTVKRALVQPQTKNGSQKPMEQTFVGQTWVPQFFSLCERKKKGVN
jgi:hypothetical protein